MTQSYNPSYSGGWGRRITSTREAEVVGSPDSATVPAWTTEQDSFSGLKKTKQDFMCVPVVYSLDLEQNLKGFEIE